MYRPIRARLRWLTIAAIAAAIGLGAPAGGCGSSADSQKGWLVVCAAGGGILPPEQVYRVDVTQGFAPFATVSTTFPESAVLNDGQCAALGELAPGRYALRFFWSPAIHLGPRIPTFVDDRFSSVSVEAGVTTIVTSTDTRLGVSAAGD